MSKVREVSERLSPLNQSRQKLILPQTNKRPLRDWIFFAQRYCAAALALETIDDVHLLPRIQLYGHAVECALKGYLVSKQQTHPRDAGHDLIRLCIKAEEFGCHLTELEAIAVVQLSSLYFRDIGSNTRYKARYPTAQSEPRESIVGDFQHIDALIDSVCSQSGA